MSEWNSEEMDVTAFRVLGKKYFAGTLNTCSLPSALEVTSGTDTGKGTGFMILNNAEASIPLLWLSFKLLLEVLWHLSFCKSEKIKLLLSSTICLRCIAMYLSERDGVSWKYDLFVHLILENSLADTCCIWALSNVVETEPQNTQQKHMLFQTKQHGPFQERNSAPLLVPCVVCEGFTEAERSRTPIAFLSKRPHHLLIHSDFPFLSDAYDNPPQVLMHAKRLRNAQQSLENTYLSFNLKKMAIYLKYFYQINI